MNIFESHQPQRSLKGDGIENKESINNNDKEKFSVSDLTEEDALNILKERYGDELNDELNFEIHLEKGDFVDALKACDSLNFLPKNSIERIDVVKFSMGLTWDVVDNQVEHLIFMDKSARILGVLVHYILSELDDNSHKLTKNRIFFINSKAIDNFDHTKDKKYGELLSTGDATQNFQKKYHKKSLTNYIIDEYSSSGKGTKKVRDYVNSLTNEYKVDKEKAILNVIRPFYSLQSSSVGFSPYRYEHDLKWPSWFDHKSTSGVMEMKDFTIKPNMNDDAKMVREDLKEASKYIANLVRKMRTV